MHAVGECSKALSVWFSLVDGLKQIRGISLGMLPVRPSGSGLSENSSTRLFTVGLLVTGAVVDTQIRRERSLSPAWGCVSFQSVVNVLISMVIIPSLRGDCLLWLLSNGN